MHTRSKGNIGENVACRFLIGNGFSIIARNYMKKWGELDIVALKDKVIHFFEVKSVTFDPEISKLSHKAEDNVHGFKRRQIRRMVETFMSETNMGIEVTFSFHIICVYLNMNTRLAKVKWIKDIIL